MLSSLANSKGVNVWCASTGGLFTNHDVISVLKATGVEKLVDHRNVILPQLAAAGIEGKEIQKKTGWRIIWGPVYAEEIPSFVEKQFKKTPEMREVRFPVAQRFEMAISWAFPISLVVTFIVLPFWREAIIPLVLLIWGLSLSIFISFPLYKHLLNTKGKRIGFVLFDFGRGGFQIILWGVLIVAIIAYSIIAINFTWGFVFRWAFTFLVVVLILSLDLMGSTPVYKSGLHEERFLKIHLDEDKCRGAGFCEEVCPKNCYEVDRDQRIATIPRSDLCVQCGAYVIQCSFDALYFISPQGEIIPPETIRKFKLNLMGKRLVKV